MFRAALLVLLGLSAALVLGQKVFVVNVSPVRANNQRVWVDGRQLTAAQNKKPDVIFEFIKPRGLKITIQGQYPPSDFYRLRYNININENVYWNAIWNYPRGVRWSYTFPQVVVRQGDTINYRVLVTGRFKGNDFEMYMEGKHDVTQPTPHGNQTNGNFADKFDVTPCQKASLTTYNGGKEACDNEPMVPSYTRVASKYLRAGADRLMEPVNQIGYQPEETFTIFSSESIVTANGRTAFVPAMLDSDGINAKHFPVQGCTAKDPAHCSWNATAYLIVPPVLSGRHTSENSFSFRYGIVEVTAKLPSGDWLVPELWLLPKEDTYKNSSGKIILAMARGNQELSDGDKDYGSRVLEAGVQVGAGGRTFRKVKDRQWSSDYHTYKLKWTPEKMEFFVDEEEIGTIQPGEEGLDPSLNGSKMAPFDQEFYLVFGLHAGGEKEFPDTLKGKPWRNTEPKNKLKFWQAASKSEWWGWGVNSVLYLKSLSVTAL